MNTYDTNVLIYSIDKKDPVKRAKARDLLRQLRSATTPCPMLWQVLGEFACWLRAEQNRGRMGRPRMVRYLESYRRIYPLILPTPAVLDRALDLSSRYSLWHSDSMLLGACLEAGVSVLYTEDMGAPRHIDSIELRNPFI